MDDEDEGVIVVVFACDALGVIFDSGIFEVVLIPEGEVETTAPTDENLSLNPLDGLDVVIVLEEEDSNVNFIVIWILLKRS